MPDAALVALSLASAFCFALALVLTQFGLRSVAPIAGAAVSVPTTAVFFAALAPFTIAFERYEPRGAALFLGAGLMFPIAVTLLTYAGNRRLGPSLTGALGNLSPVFAVALAIAILGESPSAARLAGLAIVAVGVALLALGRGGNGRASGPVWALALPLAAAFLRGIVQPVVKLGLASWPDPFAAVTIGYGVSAIVALAVVLGLRARPASPFAGDGRWFVAVGLANGLAVLTLYAALARGPVAVVAPLVACYPVMTLALDRLLNGAGRLSRLAALGVAVTVLGVGLLLAG